MKDGVIILRVEREKKIEWKKNCKKKNISLSSLIVDAVDGNLLENEKREILRFIEKQDNIFSKIETNINQIAKIANAQKYIKKKEFLEFTAKQDEILALKKQQNEIFLKIYSMLGKEYDN